MTGTRAQSRRTTFGHLEIEYDDDVLQPRAWTEHQSRWAADLLVELPGGDVLEVCAGVGHIGLLAVHGSSRHLVQVDAGRRACELARINAERAGQPVEVRHGDLKEALGPDERFVLVIADPPWVRSEHTGNHPDDPLSAIDGGHDGLDLVRACLDVIGRHLAPHGVAILQVGDREQTRAVAEYVADRPHLGLQVGERRVFDDGALVHLARLAGDATG
jgi:methylase of polypeptide subunit release factors